MSAGMMKANGLGQTSSFYTVPLEPKLVDSPPLHQTHQSDVNHSLTFQSRRFDFMGLPLELQLMILAQMTAGQLHLFRDLCGGFRDRGTGSEDHIVSSALKNDSHYTASTLYHPYLRHRLPRANTLQINDLDEVARRCEGARRLAFLVAESHLVEPIVDVIDHSSSAVIAQT